MKFSTLIKHLIGYTAQVTECKYCVPVLSYDLYCDRVYSLCPHAPFSQARSHLHCVICTHVDQLWYKDVQNNAYHFSWLYDVSLSTSLPCSKYSRYFRAHVMLTAIAIDNIKGYTIVKLNATLQKFSRCFTTVRAHLPKESLWLGNHQPQYILVAMYYQGFVYVIYYVLLFNMMSFSKILLQFMVR